MLLEFTGFWPPARDQMFEMSVTPVTLALKRQRQEDQKSEVSLGLSERGPFSKINEIRLVYAGIPRSLVWM